MKIEKYGIALGCGNYSYFFESETSFYITSDVLRSSENIGHSFCPLYNSIRALNCEMLIKVSQWKEQVLFAYIDFLSDDTENVNLTGNYAKFLKIYFDFDGHHWYIKKYELYDGMGYFLEEKEL
jgi:hypothetical protein